MNILLIIPTNEGTIASVSYDLYKGLCKQQGVNVYVVCLDYDEDGFVFENLIRNNTSKRFLKKLFYRIFGLKKIKRRYAIDESISTLLGATYWNVLSGIGEKKIGVFHTKLSQMKFRGMLYYFINYLANKTLCSMLDKMIAVNKSAYIDLIKIHGSNRKVDLAYNIHDFSKIKKLSLLPITDVKEKIIFKSPIILYVGNLYCEIKGTDRLLKAFKQVVKNNPNYKLVYIGSVPDGSFEKLQKMVDADHLSESVFFLGRKSNPYQYMRNAKMLVSPSRDEGLPGVLIEALSIGLKVVATNSSMGIWEIMECAKIYNEKLSELKQTKYGIICPNKLDDENYTIEKLSLAIEKCMQIKFDDIKNFNKDRFSEDSIIPHYILN